VAVEAGYRPVVAQVPIKMAALVEAVAVAKATACMRVQVVLVIVHLLLLMVVMERHLIHNKDAAAALGQLVALNMQAVVVVERTQRMELAATGRVLRVVREVLAPLQQSAAAVLLMQVVAVVALRFLQAALAVQVLVAMVGVGLLLAAMLPLQIVVQVVVEAVQQTTVEMDQTASSS